MSRRGEKKSLEKEVGIILGGDGSRKMRAPSETKSVTRGLERHPWATTEGRKSYTPPQGMNWHDKTNPGLLLERLIGQLEGSLQIRQTEATVKLLLMALHMGTECSL